MVKFIATFVLSIISVSALAADIATNVTIEKVSSKKQEALVRGSETIPFSAGQLINADTDCALQIVSADSTAAVVSFALCRDKSNIRSGRKMYLVQKSPSNTRAHGGTSSGSYNMVSSAEELRTGFRVALLKSALEAKIEIEDAEEFAILENTTSDARQEIGIAIGYSSVPISDFGYDFEVSANRFESANNPFVRVAGGGTWGFANGSYAIIGANLGKFADGLYSYGFGAQGGIGIRKGRFDGRLIYTHMATRSTTDFFGTNLDVDTSIYGLEISVGAVF